jgi:hypothetical protein
MKKIFLSIVSILLVFSALNAQQKGANISFETETHDFGKIQESNGNVEYKFDFTNTGSTPLIITNVKASCGCTSPTWTEKPVMPGQKGFVSAVFNPARRPGKFNKSILVETNTEKARVVLRILGEVIPREKTVDDYYPKAIGALKLETNHFAFVKVYNNQLKVDTLKIYNPTDRNMEIRFDNVPAYLKLSISSSIIKPKEKAFIIGEYDGAKANDWGFVTNRVKLFINNEELPAGVLTISAKIEEDFSQLTPEDLKKASAIVFESREFNFGSTKSKDKIEHTFNLKNEGKSDLVIHKIRATCGCTTVAPAKTVIKPGESSSFKAIFTPGSRKGKQHKSIYVISNDPKNPSVRLMIKGEILQ